MGWTKAPGEERRGQIMSAALAVAARDGLARLTLRAVADEAALSHGSVVFHFGSKEALLSGLLEVLLDWLDEAPAEAAATDFTGFLREEVAAADRKHVAVLLDFWVVGTRTPALRDRLREAITGYESRLAAIAARDELCVSGRADPSGLAALGAAVVFGTALRTLLDPGPAGGLGHDGTIEVLQDLLRPGLDRPPPPR